MVGEEQAFAQAMWVKGNERRTNLVWLLKDRFKPEEQSKQESSDSTENTLDKEEKAEDYILTGGPDQPGGDFPHGWHGGPGSGMQEFGGNRPDQGARSLT